MQSVARWLELLAFGVYVYDNTKSPLLVTLVTLLKLAPLALFGPITGALTSRVTSRSLYLAGMILMLLTTITGLVLALRGSLEVWQVMLISFLGGLFWVLDFPVRRAWLGDAVSSMSLGNAMGLDTIANNGTRMLGPLLGGVVLQYAGLTGVFILTFALYVMCTIFVLNSLLGREVVIGNERFGLISIMRQGLRVVSQTPVLYGTLMVTIIYNLFGFPVLSLVPVLGREELQLSASVIGLLASMEGSGALLGGVLFILFGRIRYFRKIYVFSVAGCFVFGLAYATSNTAGQMGAALLLIGIGSAGFSVMQTTLLILNSEVRNRAQVLGLLSFCIGSGIIGFTQIGLMASWLGPRSAIFISATLGLITLILVCLRCPQIVGVQAET